jgi:hypothetical protein
MLPLLGRRPQLGRSFTEADAREGAQAPPCSAMRSGQAVHDDRRAGPHAAPQRQPHTVIGVMPESFRFPTRETQVWTAFRLGASDFEDRTDTYIYVVAKRRRDVPLDQARAEMRLVAGRLESSYPAGSARVTAQVIPLREHVSGQARLLLRTLFAPLCVLLIACTNLASLLVARGVRRKGWPCAPRWARAQRRPQLLTESLVLAAVGGALGVMLATAAVPWSRGWCQRCPSPRCHPSICASWASRRWRPRSPASASAYFPRCASNDTTGATGLREGARSATAPSACARRW